MSDCAIDFQAAETVLRARRTPVIRLGTRLDRAFFAWCKAAEYGVVEIMSLFEKGSNSASTLRYPCEFQCPACGTWREKAYGRKSVQLLISIARGLGSSFDRSHFECEACLTAREEARKQAFDPHHLEKLSHELRERAMREAQTRTPAFIELYLDRASLGNRRRPCIAGSR